MPAIPFLAVLGVLASPSSKLNATLAGTSVLLGFAVIGRCARCHINNAELFTSGDRLQSSARFRRSIPEISELTPVPGNIGLSVGEKNTRVREIFQPYHDRIDTELNRRQNGRPRALIAMHSFTPAFMGVIRSWHAAVLYNRDARLARILMALLKSENNFVTGENKPYDISDDSDYTIPFHGERRGLHHVGIEIRQDLILGSKVSRSGVRDSRSCYRALISKPLLQTDLPTKGLIASLSKFFCTAWTLIGGWGMSAKCQWRTSLLLG